MSLFSKRSREPQLSLSIEPSAQAERPVHSSLPEIPQPSDDFRELQSPQFSQTFKLSARQAIRLYAEHREEVGNYWRHRDDGQELSLGASIIVNGCQEFREGRSAVKELAKVQEEQQENPTFSLDRFLRKMICNVAVGQAKELELYLDKSAPWHALQLMKVAGATIAGTVGVMVGGILAGMGQNLILDLAMIPAVAGVIIGHRTIKRIFVASYYRGEFAKEINQEIKKRTENPLRLSALSEETNH